MTTITQSISALPEEPSSLSPSTFESLADGFLGGFPTLRTQVNTWAGQANTVAGEIAALVDEAEAAAVTAQVTGTIWVSGTTYAIGAARFSPTNYQTYRRKTAGAGTTDPVSDTTNWVPLGSVGDHVVECTGGSGYGSTSTKIRLFTTKAKDVGTAITDASSASLGYTFTIAEPGLYAIYYTDSGTGYFGVSVNSAQLTTSIGTITAANRLLYSGVGGDGTVAVSDVVRLVAGDVIRAHADGAVTGTTAAGVVFRIRKVGF